MSVRIPLALSVLAIAALTQAQIDPDRVVVKVNGSPILGKDYYKRMEVQPGLGTVGAGGKFVQVYPGYLALRWLIEEELIIQLAKSKGLAPTQAQVDAEFKYRLDSHPEQFKALVQFGFTEADMKRNVLVDMSEFNVLTEGITITDFEIEKYYKDHPEQFTLPKRYTLRIIRVKEDGKKPVDDALAKGEKFEDVAAKYSVDLSKLDGGRIGVFPEADINPATRTAIVATKKGAVSPWVEQNGDFARFLVEDIQDQQVLPLDADMKKSLRENMMRERGSARNNMLIIMQEFRKKAKLEFNNYPFADEMKRHFEVGG